MPWKEPDFVLFDPRIRASLKCDNLSFDHDGRFAFIHGNLVQCTRKNINYFANIDFCLGGGRAPDRDITTCFHWKNVPGTDRALLVVGTEKENDKAASFQIWTTGHQQGTLLWEWASTDSTLANGSFIDHICSFSQLSAALTCPPLLVGTSSGQVLLFIARKKLSQFVHVLTMTGLVQPILCLRADVTENNFVAAADESGKVIVWSAELISDEGYGYKVTYEFDSSVDLCTTLAMRDGILITGHVSGALRFHNVRKKYVYADLITNSKAILCMDVHPLRDWLAVGGEDCRMSCLEFARDDQHESVLLLSYCINGAITGLQFTRPEVQIPSLAIIVFELPYIILYDYQPSNRKGLTATLIKPRSKMVKTALDNRRRRVGDRGKVTMREVEEVADQMRSSSLYRKSRGGRSSVTFSDLPTSSAENPKPVSSSSFHWDPNEAMGATANSSSNHASIFEDDEDETFPLGGSDDDRDAAVNSLRGRFGTTEDNN